MNVFKRNLSYIIISVVVLIFSVFTISNSQGADLKLSFPSEGVDCSEISWTEVPIDANGQTFSLLYTAWDIGQIGIRMSGGDENNDNTLVLTIRDSAGNEYSREYNTDELETDSEGLTWLDIDQHITAGNTQFIFKSPSSNNIKIIGYFQDGVVDENGNSVLSLNARVNAASFPKIRAYLFSFVWIVIILAGSMVLSTKKITYEKLFVILYAVMGLMAFLVYSPFAEPDSGNHYRRAYAISEGDIFPSLDSENAIGGLFKWPSTWETGDSVSVSWYEAGNRIGFDVTDPENEKYITYTNIALYSPICHLVPAMTMAVTRLFTHSIILIEMMAKLLNYIVIGVTLYCGIKMAPFGKEYFLWIAVHPFIMKQYTSISPDIMTAALVYLLTATVLRLRYDHDAFVNKRLLAALYIVPFLLGQFKIVYIAFCVLLFLIPMNKFKNRKSYFFHAIAIGLVTIVPALGWLKISSHILSMGYTEISSVNKEIAMRPLQYIPILLNTFRIRGYDYIMQFFGSTLSFKDGTNNAIVLLFIICVAAYISRNSALGAKNQSEAAILVRKDTVMKTVILTAIIITTLLIFTAEFIQWTDPGASNINGVSGRYFFPFIYPFLILMTGMSDEKEINNSVASSTAIKTLFTLTAITLCFVAQLYIVYQL